MLDHVDEEDRVLFDAKDDPVAAVDPGFGVVLVRMDRLDVKRAMLSVGVLLQGVEERLGLLRGPGPGRTAFSKVPFRLSHSRLDVRVVEPDLVVGHQGRRVEREE